MDSRSTCFAHCQSLPTYSQKQGHSAFFGGFAETIDLFIILSRMFYKRSKLFRWRQRGKGRSFIYSRTGAEERHHAVITDAVCFLESAQECLPMAL
jgi:hypothetical protein